MQSEALCGGEKSKKRDETTLVSFYNFSDDSGSVTCSFFRSLKCKMIWIFVISAQGQRQRIQMNMWAEEGKKVHIVYRNWLQ